MTVGYSVEADQAQLAEAISLFEFVGGNSADALRIAINKTGPKIRTASSRKIREQVRLTASYVGGKIAFVRATRGNLNGSIRTESRGLRLAKFSTDAQISSDGVSWLKPPAIPSTGLKVKVKPAGAAQAVDGKAGMSKPFLIVGKSSHALLIVQRDENDKLKALYGPSISQVFNTVRGDVLPAAGDEFTRQMVDAMRYLLRKQLPAEA